MDSGLWCFLILAQILEIPVPHDSMDSFSSDGDTEYELLKLAKKCGMKTRSGRFSLRSIKKLAQPFLAERKDATYSLVLRMDGEEVLLLEQTAKGPQKISMDDFKELSSGRYLIFGRKGKDNKGNEEFGFQWFLPVIFRFKKQFLCVLLAVFLIQILGIITPLMTQVVVDKVLTHNAFSTLTAISIGILISYVYELAISLSKNYLFAHTTNRIDVILSQKLYHHLFALPLKYFESRRVGETIARVRELENVRSFLCGTPLSSLIDVMFITVYLAVLYLYSVPLAIIVTLSIPLFALLSLCITPLFKKSLDEKFRAGANAQSQLVESVNGILTVKSFALEEKREDSYGDMQAQYVKAGYKTSMISSASGSIATFIQRLIDLIVLIEGAKAVMKGSMTIGELVAFRMLASRVSGPVLRLVSLWQEYQQASLSVQRIGDIFQSPMERVSSNTLQDNQRVEGNITFDKVWFRYRMDAGDVLKGISFTIGEGKIVGLVGRSGSGKSTVSKLVQRLYLPQNGKIAIDGRDIALMNPNMLRKQIGVVLQENFMFNGTVAENIAIHCKNKTMEEIIAAAKVAGAHDFIEELQEGYDTLIGEQGVSLSGGQKQRVAIARAIIHNPRILIFDEATSALDYESESIIQRNMKEICKGRTVLIIAHRLSTLRIADEIMVIDHGSIVERGTHDRLMADGGLYAGLYQKQLRGEVE